MKPSPNQPDKSRDVSKLAHQFPATPPQVDSVSGSGYNKLSPVGITHLSNTLQHTSLVSSTDDEIESPTTSLQQLRPVQSPQSSVRGTRPSMSVTSRPVAPESKVASDAIRSYGRSPDNYVPATYTWDDGPSNVPGTAKYYKSRAFRDKREKKDSPQGPDLTASSTEDMTDHGESGLGEKGNPAPKSLVMIFSRTNVRRACANRKVHLRQQRQNRRAKFWRGVNKETLFEWD